LPRSESIVIIGGGAAGFFCGIQIAEQHCKLGRAVPQITILEANKEPLIKVKISGGGRCNVTHACFDPLQLAQHYPRGNQELKGAFHIFQPQDTISWFTQHGVALKTEADGRIFPASDDSLSIVQCLLKTATDYGIKLYTQAVCSQVKRHEDQRFLVTLKSGQTIICDRLVLATGSHPSGYKIARSLGHEIIAPIPSLFTFQVSDPKIHALMGLSVGSVKISLDPKFAKSCQSGSILFTHWGFSGPAVLKLSAWMARELHACQYQTEFYINWINNDNMEQVYQELRQYKLHAPKRKTANSTQYHLPQRLWCYLLEKSEIDLRKLWTEVGNKQLHLLAKNLTKSSYHLAGKGVFKEEFVTCGGVSLRQVNWKSMESRVCPHLYFAGEILDIDGVTGGFNLQSAWTTGYIAGLAISKCS